VRPLFVDSSVWIDFLRGSDTPETALLRTLLAEMDPRSGVADPPGIIVGDLVLFEVLRGVRSRRDQIQASRMLRSHVQVDLGGAAMANRAAAHYRHLRTLGVTVRKTVDCFIAAWCIEHAVPLLHSDRDFVPFAKHCGLRPAGPAANAAHASP
jgi:hypothetical protein